MKNSNLKINWLVFVELDISDIDFMKAPTFDLTLTTYNEKAQAYIITGSVKNLVAYMNAIAYKGDTNTTEEELIEATKQPFTTLTFAK